MFKKPEQVKKLTPLKAIRARCLFCSNNQFLEIKNCLIPDCPFYPFRFGKGSRRKGSILKIIREYCFGCGEGTKKDIRDCDVENCPVYLYRFGKRLKTPFQQAFLGKKSKKSIILPLNRDTSQNSLLQGQNSTKTGIVEEVGNLKTEVNEKHLNSTQREDENNPKKQ